MKRIVPSLSTVASELGFIEGPIVIQGRIYLCNIKDGVIWQVMEGKASVFAQVGGGPNGLAIGADNHLYVANNGGRMRWEEKGKTIISHGFEREGYDSRIERIDLSSGKIVRVADKVDGRRFEAIDDLVFDGRRGFWFTDLGRDGARDRSYGGVYWMDCADFTCKPGAYPLPMGANGIGISPDGSILYATEYGAGRLWSWPIVETGVLGSTGKHQHGGRLVWQAPNASLLDSLAVAPSGNVFIANQPEGQFSVISPGGEHLADILMPEAFPTNICFDPDQPDIAYATLSSTGTLVRINCCDYLCKLIIG